MAGASTPQPGSACHSFLVAEGANALTPASARDFSRITAVTALACELLDSIHRWQERP